MVNKKVLEHRKAEYPITKERGESHAQRVYPGVSGESPSHPMRTNPPPGNKEGDT